MIGIYIEDSITGEERKRVRYVFKTFFSVMGIPCTFCNEIDERHLVPIFYGALISKELGRHLEKSGGIWIHRSPGERVEHDSPLNISNIGHKENFFEIDKDIISSAFRVLSGQQEAIGVKDDLGRPSAEDCTTDPAGYPRVPIVNVYIDIFFRAIRVCLDKRGIPLVQKYPWPEGRPYAACLTHDIDRIDKWPLPSFLYHGLKGLRYVLKLELGSGCGEILSLFKSPKGIGDILQLEAECDFKSSFYFRADIKKKTIAFFEYLLSKVVPLKSFSIGYAPGYNIRSKSLKKGIERIEHSGGEIGLHASFGSYNDPKKLASEKKLLEEILGRKIQGVRQHYLRFEIPKTWEIQENSGFRYDTTLGYTDDIGFRAGLCFPFYPYSRKILEIPLTVMDAALSEHSKRSSKDPWDGMRETIDFVNRHNGLITLLWHNDLFEYEDRAEIYKKCLSCFRRSGAWTTSAQTIAEWFKLRENLDFDYDGTLISIKGFENVAKDLSKGMRLRIHADPKEITVDGTSLKGDGFVDVPIDREKIRIERR